MFIYIWKESNRANAYENKNDVNFIILAKQHVGIFKKINHLLKYTPPPFPTTNKIDF